MLIDIHTHLTLNNYPEFAKAMLGRPAFTADTLLKRMDMEGIERSVLLPLISPENVDFYGVAGNSECLDAARRHPDRFDVFCNIDPRTMINKASDRRIRTLFEVYRDLGCKGMGEICGGLPVDDERYIRLFQLAGEFKMPLIFHFQRPDEWTYGAIDDPGLPRLEHALQLCPDTVFLGHSPCFWNEIDGDLSDEEKNRYPNSPYVKKGKLWELFEKYPNLWGDCSAGSGHRALSKDPKGYEFLEKFHEKVCFGTDRFTAIDEPIPPIIGYLKEGLDSGKLSQEAYDCITHKNYLRLTK
ncbi:MAG: amidohydrolase family protein [Lentisphaeria bacterium]|nr:amidohydrolase family protein [Lentisphaeria bacterium]